MLFYLPNVPPYPVSSVSTKFPSQLSIRTLGVIYIFLSHEKLIPAASASTTAPPSSPSSCSHSPVQTQMLMSSPLRWSPVPPAFQESAHPVHWCQIWRILVITSVPYFNFLSWLPFSTNYKLLSRPNRISISLSNPGPRYLFLLHIKP